MGLTNSLFKLSTCTDRQQLTFTLKHALYVVTLVMYLIRLCSPRPHVVRCRDMMCYGAFADVMTWSDAETECQENDGHLVTMTSDTIRRLIEELLRERQAVRVLARLWIGAEIINSTVTDDGSTDVRWTWLKENECLTTFYSNGSTSGCYNKFAVNVSLQQHHCVYMDIRQDFRWLGASCNDLYNFICQREQPKKPVMSKPHRDDWLPTIAERRLVDEDIPYSGLGTTTDQQRHFIVTALCSALIGIAIIGSIAVGAVVYTKYRLNSKISPMELAMVEKQLTR